MRAQFAEQANLLDDMLTAFGRHPVPVNACWAIGYGLLVGVVCLQRFAWAHQVTAGQVTLTGLCGIVAIAAIMLRHRYPLPALACCLATGYLSYLLGIGRVDSEAILITLWTVLVTRPPRIAALAWCGTAVSQVAVNRLAVWQVPTALYTQVIMEVTPLMALTGLALLVRWRRYTTEQRRRARLEQAEQRMLAARLRVAADMHDTIGHGLTSVINLTDVALLALRHGDDQDAAASLQRANSLARQTLTESRGVIARLRGDSQPPFVPQPSLADLPAIFETAERAGLTVQVQETGERPVGLLATDVYRIVQEAVTNTLRHAREATRICIDLTHEPQLTRVRILDNGRMNAAAEPGNGLAGMTERVAAHRGTLQTGPTAQGWQVVATLPWAAA